MQPFQKHELLKRLEAYTNAWEAYVLAVNAKSPDRFKRGHEVTDRKEKLLDWIKALG